MEKQNVTYDMLEAYCEGEMYREVIDIKNKLIHCLHQTDEDKAKLQERLSEIKDWFLEEYFKLGI